MLLTIQQSPTMLQQSHLRPLHRRSLAVYVYLVQHDSNLAHQYDLLSSVHTLTNLRL